MGCWFLLFLLLLLLLPWGASPAGSAEGRAGPGKLVEAGGGGALPGAAAGGREGRTR